MLFLLPVLKRLEVLFGCDLVLPFDPFCLSLRIHFLKICFWVQCFCLSPPYHLPISSTAYSKMVASSYSKLLCLNCRFFLCHSKDLGKIQSAFKKALEYLCTIFFSVSYTVYIVIYSHTMFSSLPSSVSLSCTQTKCCRFFLHNLRCSLLYR